MDIRPGDVEDGSEVGARVDPTRWVRVVGVRRSRP